MAYLNAKPARVDLGKNRVVLDVSSLVGWTGPPNGIIRVEQELARHARLREGNVILSFRDASNRWRMLRPEWTDLVLGPEGTISKRLFAQAKIVRGLRRRLLPRYAIMETLEGWRLTATSKYIERAVAALQWLVMLGRITRPFADDDGVRIAVLPPDLALGEELVLEPGDTVVFLDWWGKNVEQIATEKSRHGFRCVALCYDLIPLLFPSFYFPDDVENFRRHWASMFALADRTIAISNHVRGDVLRYCEANDIAVRDVQVVPLGYDFQPTTENSTGSLPPGLEPDRFALLVATIEPRKGHDLMLRIWRRLLAEGVPQRLGFKLVFVGRAGWKVGDLLRQLKEASRPSGMLVHFDHMPDAALATLYRNAAFCVLPSLVEGFGLPVVEAFSFGKAMLVSNGGALPEVVGEFSPILDVNDEGAWYAALRRWIEEPAARRDYEARIRSRFVHPSWEQAATRFFTAVAEGS